ncbi:hypothetical protein BpHYR1_022504 [Brachionus plicatilis]|uniref:Uncharacterized protein n=1 Tax=Brachionus plicatilis TaxID=10195 RepID=A0A3M7R3F4_BRAPC|nr:hypothetical protein BpHYR1_022504 [Brachionus plicatilis]
MIFLCGFLHRFGTQEYDKIRINAYCNYKGYGAIRSKIGLFTFFNFSIVILVDLDALIPNICVFFVLAFGSF